ncbi:PREDICTED: geranylgeranyl transferase type-1 subunit beta [Tarenaya hassleriana]|uniref:geranylgeranyl transferase type-1 subunit beta n=1 Tax=Tarenaya hassleriana TaxID=28532 RepID=UPI00053C1ADA|nr:PREDICTED: geranylgeranyl transferase type-1 subunit beta [Tarenaya hassleriana]
MDGGARDWERSEVQDDNNADEEEEEEEEEEEDSSLGLVMPLSPDVFEKDRHVMFLEMMYELLPYHYQSQEINRLTLAHFVISGLRFLGAIDRVDKDVVASWVLSFQARPGYSAAPDNGQLYGFHGSRSSQFPVDKNGVLTHNGSHLASTYCALAILKNIGHDFSNFDSESLLLSMRNLQQPDGSFMPIHIGGEMDLRFVYCAAAICYMLDDWRGMDREKAKNYILNCQSYDGGFGLVPGSESHGGGTYCAIASLRLMGFIEDDLLSNNTSCSIIDPSMLLNWCLQRQASDGGFQGRPNKPSDTCYAFWIGAVLKLLGASELIDENSLRGFLLTCQYKYGGFSKFPRELPDLYHSYYGYTAFALLEEPSLNPLCPELGIPSGI